MTRGANPVSLTSKEFDLLMLFAENRNVALFRENLYEIYKIITADAQREGYNDRSPQQKLLRKFHKIPPCISQACLRYCLNRKLKNSSFFNSIPFTGFPIQAIF